jgi:acyl-CoA synthetase (AMP-forming)/AMP-acid ligase II
LKSGFKATEGEIIEFCKDKLASFKKPKSVEFMNELPKTGSGKIYKKELRDKYWKGHSRKVIVDQ